MSKGLIRFLSLALMVISLSACSVSAPVHSITRIEGKLVEFTGIAVGYLDRTGTIEMKNRDGITCAGKFRYTGTRTGIGHLTCSNGEKSDFQFNGLSAVSGYGYGTSSNGYPIAFTFGLDESERRRYLRLDERFASRRKPPQHKKGKGGTGSGFSVGNGLFVSNAHVIEGCKSVTLGHSHWGVFKGDVVAQDKSNDLAAIRVEKWSGSSLSWNRDRDIRAGIRVATYGYPYGGAIASAGSLSTGDVNALTGMNDDSRFLQISAPVQPGNSGGPLVNIRGELVGMVTSKLNAIKIAKITGDIPQNVNFALKTATLEIFLATNKLTKPNAKVRGEMKMPEIAEMLSDSTAKIT